MINCGRDESHQGQVMLLWQHLTEEAGSVWSFRKTFLRKWNWSWDLRCSIGEGQENLPSPGKKYGPPKEWQHARQLGQKVRAGEWHKVKLVRSGEPRSAGPASRSKQGCWTLFQEVTAGCKPSRQGSPAEGQTLRSKKQARGQVQVQLLSLCFLHGYQHIVNIFFWSTLIQLRDRIFQERPKGTPV